MSDGLKKLLKEFELDNPAEYWPDKCLELMQRADRAETQLAECQKQLERAQGLLVTLCPLPNGCEGIDNLKESVRNYLNEALKNDRQRR